MQVIVRCVEGFDMACEAVRLSFNSKSNEENIVQSAFPSLHADLWEDDFELLKKLIVSGDSHSKVMRMVNVWIDLTMPRYWWSEFDTYKVGTTAMSESSVHRLQKRIKDGDLCVEDFEYTDNTELDTHLALERLQTGVEEGFSIEELKQMLPESFLQRRIVCTNYQTLRHIYFDRRNHRLPIWHKFLDNLLEQLPFPELITIEK